MTDYVLIPDEPDESDEAPLAARFSTGAPCLVEELDGRPVLAFTEDGLGEREQYAVREVDSGSAAMVTVKTSRASFVFPADMPVAVSGAAKDPRAVDAGVDLSVAHSGAAWILAGDLAWNDGLFWAPEHSMGEASDSMDETPSKPGLRWLELVMSVVPLKPGKAGHRLQVLTAPSYFVASDDRNVYGILVSGATDVSRPSGGTAATPVESVGPVEPTVAPTVAPKKRTTKKI